MVLEKASTPPVGSSSAHLWRGVSSCTNPGHMVPNHVLSTDVEMSEVGEVREGGRRGRERGEGGGSDRSGTESPDKDIVSFRSCARPGEAKLRGRAGGREGGGCPSVASAKSRQMFLLTGVLRLPAGGVPGRRGGDLTPPLHHPPNLLITRRVVV